MTVCRSEIQEAKIRVLMPAGATISPVPIHRAEVFG
jgi:hypothetical protein